MYRLHRAMLAYQDARGQADSVITALSPAAWYRNATDVVSSGGFASIWADYASSDKALILPGVAGNFASIPDSAAIPLLDVDARARISANDWTPAGTMHIAGQRPGNVSWELNLTGAGTINVVAQGGTINSSSTAALSFTDGDARWVRFTRQESSGDIKFYYSTDATNDPSAVSWTQLGTTVSAATGSLGDIAGLFTIGAQGDTGGSAAFAGKVYRVAFYSTIGGATPAFDADFSTQTIGAGSFTESSSNAATVTINASGAAPAHIGKARDLLQGTGTNQPAYNSTGGVFTFDGADNFMRAAFSIAQPVTVYAVVQQESWTLNDRLYDGQPDLSMMLQQSTASPQIRIFCTSGGSATSSSLAVGSYGIVCGVFSGASSIFRINNEVDISGASLGTTAPDGICLGSRWTGINNAHASHKEFVMFGAAHDDTTRDSVITALNNALTVF